MVLAVLLSHVNHTVSQDTLIEETWAGEPPDAARSTLQSYVHGLRRELGSESIIRDGDGYRVEADEQSFDAIRFESQVSEARQQLEDDPADTADILKGALAMWYGAPYGGLGNNPNLISEVTRLEELRLMAVETHIEAELALGNHAEVVGELDTLVREFPLRERLRAQQMLALYRCGRQAEALRAFQRARSYLGEELGINPSSELRDLEQRILDQDPTLLLATTPIAGFPARKGAPTHLGVRVVRGYELRELVGEGHFGVVYRAFHPSIGREVAIKVIRPEYANQPDFVRRFDGEAKLVAKLEHPHIVPLMDHWRDPDGACLVMPYLRGGSMAAALTRGRWELAPALALIEQVGGALAHAHRLGVIHGALKPTNVLLDDDGDAHLTDFGQAILLSDSAGSAPTTLEAIRAPETVNGGAPTERSDEFGLGVLIFQILTGFVPRGGLALPPLSEARPGLPLDLDQVLARATDFTPETRFPRVEDMLTALSEAAGVEKAAGEPAQHVASSEPNRNPYKGLQAFMETDGGDFFGRTALIDELLHAVATRSLVAVVGPSGSGKSSAVRAGVIPALRAGGIPGSRPWLITDMYPGSYPFEELEAALLRVAVDRPPGLLTELLQPNGLIRVSKQILPHEDHSLLLVIDQFEELFSSVVSEATRRLFIDSLVSVAGDARSRVRVVITLRADFLDRPLEYAEFAEILGKGMVVIGPPTRDGLAQAIATPAIGVGARLEPGLVGRIIGDVENQPGTLPLLQYALTELFDHGEGGTLTIDDYESTGGVVGALGRRAEELYQEQDERGREAVRQLFLRLVAVDESAADTRRRARQSELRGLAVDKEALENAVLQFGAFRLLSFDRDPVTRGPTVEVAHEALLREWSRLHDWIEERREGLVISRRINTAAREWVESGLDSSFLLRGARLEQAEEWVKVDDIAVTAEEVDYLVASQEQRTAEESEIRIADGRRLAGEALSAIEEDSEVAILLALEAVRLSISAGEPALPEAIGALDRAIQASRLELVIPARTQRLTGRGSRSSGAAVTLRASHRGDWFASTDMADRLTDVLVWDAAGKTRSTLRGPGGAAWHLAVAADDATIAVGYDATELPDHPAIVIFAPDTGAELTRLAGPPAAYHSVAISGDGRRAAAASAVWPAPRWFDDYRITVWDVETGAEMVSFPVLDTDYIDFLPGGDELVAKVGEIENRLVVYSTATGAEIRSIDSVDLRDGDEARGIALDPTGTRIAVISAGRVLVYDLDTHEQIFDIAAAGAVRLAWRSDGKLLAIAGTGITVIEPETGSTVYRLAAGGWMRAVAFHTDGERLLGVSSGVTRVWNVTPRGPPDLGAIATHLAPMSTFRISPDQSQVAAFTFPPGGFELIDAASGELLVSLSNEIVSVGFERAVSPDFSLVGSFQTNGRSTIRKLASLEVAAELEPFTNPVAISPDNAMALINEFAGGDYPPGPPRTSKVIDIKAGTTVFEIPQQVVVAAQFNPPGDFAGGRYLAVSDLDSLDLYDTITGERMATLRAEDVGGNILYPSFDPRGRYVVAGTQESRVVAVDLAAVVSGSPMLDALIFNRAAHPAEVPGASITTDGVIGTHGFDSVVRLWNIESDRPLVEFRTDQGDQSRMVAFSPDGSYLLYPDTGNLIRRFYIDPERLIELAEGRVTRRLTPEECRRYHVASG